MTPPHIKKYFLERAGEKMVGYAIFESDRKIFRAEVEVGADGSWKIRGVPFYEDGEVRLYEMTYDEFDKNRYVVFYPWDGDFSRRLRIATFEIGVKRPEIVVSYYGSKMVYGGVVKSGYVILSSGGPVEVYRNRKLLALLDPRDVECFIGSGLEKIMKKKS